MDKKDEVEVKKVETVEKVTDTIKGTVETPTDEYAKLTGTYIIRPVKSTWLRNMDGKHDGAIMFSKAENWLSPERDKLTGLVKTGLSDNLARRLEKEMGLKEMELSPYSKWWGVNFKLYPRIPREGLELNVDASVINKLIYCYTKVCSKVAQSEADARDNPRYDYVITSKEVEAVYNSKKIEIKGRAFKRFMETAITEQMDFLKVYEEGRFRATKSASPDYITSTLGKIVDEHPESFLELIDNSDFKTMVFVQDCISIGAIKKTGTKYYVNGADIIGHTFADTINNLQNPEYNEIKLSLKTKLELSKR